MTKMRTSWRKSQAASVGAILAIGLLAASSARGDRIDNGVAVFSALDKVTARTSKFEVPLNSTVQFGALKVTPRVCYSRPPEEQPKTTSFVEVDEIQLDGQEKRIFTGWMFAASPGLHAVEHPVYDVWLVDCKMQMGPEPERVPPDAEAAQDPDEELAPPPDAGAPED